jgi:putative membrane protein
MMCWPNSDVTGWGWGAMTIPMVLFLAVLALGAVLLFRALNRPGERLRGPRPSPEQLLAERFARGEIDEEEYRRRLATLSWSSGFTNAP